MNEEKLSSLVKFLRDTGHTQASIAAQLGVSQPYVNALLTGRKAFGKSQAKKWGDLYGISPSWLLTGEGTMVKDASAPVPVPVYAEDNPGASLPDIGRRTDVWVGKDDRVYWTEAIQVGDEEDYHRATQEGVKLIPEFAEAFRGGTEGEAEELRTVDTYWGLPDVDGNMVVPIRGDSMAPRYPAGCRVVLKPYPFNPRRPLLLPFGEVFAVAVRQEDGYPPTHYLKKLHRHPDKAKENDYYIARSFNKEYEDFEIPINGICFLSAVVAKIDLEHTFTF
nr:helix-turn-helix domain-containing protein [uncultured Porphyromonas sp.]